MADVDGIHRELKLVQYQESLSEPIQSKLKVICAIARYQLTSRVV